MTINKENYFRLLDKLESFRKNPAEFNYKQGFYLDQPGCIDCVCRILMGNTEFIQCGGGSISLYLNITSGDATWLWAPATGNDEVKLKDFFPKGLDYIKEYYQKIESLEFAIAKVKYIGRKYGIEVDFKPNEEKFLNELKESFVVSTPALGK